MKRKSNVLSVCFVSMLIICGLMMVGCGTFAGWFGGGKSDSKAVQEEESVIDVANFTNRSMMQAVSRITDDGLPKASPVISPDGERLLYTETRTVLNTETGESTIQSDIVMLRNINSSAKTPLVTTGNAFTPGWYEDSTRYLFSFGENNTHRIVRSSTAGGGRTNITRNPVGRRDERPRVKNGVILFQTSESGNWMIYYMRENGTDVTRLGQGLDPVWHPTEEKILYTKGSPRGIWEMDLTNMQETLLYEMPGFNIRRPQYTYDGRHIVFQRGSEQVVTGTQVVTETTGNRQARTQTATTSTEVRWQLYSINADGSNESVLTEGNVDCTYPTLDQDNNLFFISNATGVRADRTEIYKARLVFD